jgi:uncharacterized membrane protein YccC
MFHWSLKKITKSVTFNQEIADDSLLEVVENHLQKQPHKTFSDLCKEALWQYLCVPESVRPSANRASMEQPNTAQMEQLASGLQRQLAEFEQRLRQPNPAPMEQLVTELQQQLAEFEQRLVARESQRLEAMEIKLNQLSQQLAQFSLIVHTQQPNPQPITQIASEPEEAVTPTPPPEEVDPLLSRLGAFIDDF